MMPHLILLPLTMALSWCCCVWVCRHAERLRLVQAPNHRSSHIRPTPAGGGIGIVIAASLAGVLLLPTAPQPLGWSMLGLALLMAVTGLVDDIRPVSARTRFATQFALVLALLLVLGEMPQLQLHAGWAIGGALLAGLLLIAGLWWINLFNFMDGIDGIAGSEASYMLLAAALLSLWLQPNITQDALWLFMLYIAGSAIGFLAMNWPPARIFLGDVGSTYLAFLIFSLALASIQAGWLTFPCWLVLGAVFIVDATITLLTRMLRGERWYEAHRSHAYQRIARRMAKHGHTHLPVTLGVFAINLFWLLPLAAATLAFPSKAWLFAALAYLPLAGLAVGAGAGKADHV